MRRLALSIVGGNLIRSELHSMKLELDINFVYFMDK